MVSFLLLDLEKDVQDLSMCGTLSSLHTLFVTNWSPLQGRCGKQHSISLCLSIRASKTREHVQPVFQDVVAQLSISYFQRWVQSKRRANCKRFKA